MGYASLVLLLVVATVIATKGSWRMIARARFRLSWLIIASFALQALASFLEGRHELSHSVAAALVLLSYLGLLGFCVSNFRWVGVILIGVGLTMNAIAIAANSGMPTRTPSRQAPISLTAKHRPSSPSDQFTWLTDTIWIPRPFASMVSVGDLVIASGLCWVAFSASRNRKTDGLVKASTDDTSPVEPV